MFRWNEWNLDHAGKHGVSPQEAQKVVLDARRPYPRDVGNGKRQVVGRGRGGRWIQVIYIDDPDGRKFIIHARPLTDSEKRASRRKERPR